MSATAFSGIQTLVDNYITATSKKYPDAKIGVVIGAVTPAEPAGGLIFSKNQIVTQSKQSITPSSSTPFELGSVSKVFTTGIYSMLQSTPNFEGTLGQRLGSQMTMSDTVKAIPIQCLASFSSGFPQDNGHCPLHPSTGYPAGLTATLQSLFNYLATYDTMAYTPGTTYSYSNLAMSLVSMAALNLDSTDTDAFGTAYNNALIQYCQMFGVDPTGSSPTTIVYNQVDTGSLPIGYDTSFQQKIAPPCSIVEYGSGGVVSTGADMLNFLLYCMSTNYPAFMQEYRWQHPQYCSAGEGPITGYGWFIGTQQIKNQPIRVVSKDGAVAGFTAWIALEQRPSLGTKSPRGVFILTNGPDAVTLGKEAFARLIPPESAPADDDFLQAPELSFDPRVH
jgi:hypothetical protein